MHIKQIRLNQFKLFDKLHLDTKKLTLLTGVNSSGKSSILNSLAAISQTESPHNYPFDFIPNGVNCSLGSYKDIVTRHNTRKSFGIGFSVDYKKTQMSLDSLYRYSARGDHILLHSMLYKSDEDFFETKWKGHEKGYVCRLTAPSLYEIQKDEFYQKFMGGLEKYIVSLNKKTKGKSKAKNRLKKFSIPNKDKIYRISNCMSPRDLPFKIRNNAVGNYLLEGLKALMNGFKESVCQYPIL